MESGDQAERRRKTGREADRASEVGELLHEGPGPGLPTLSCHRRRRAPEGAHPPEPPRGDPHAERHRKQPTQQQTSSSTRW